MSRAGGGGRGRGGSSRGREGTDLMGRKVWDKSFYREKAAARVAAAGSDDEDLAFLPSLKKERVYPPPDQRTGLRTREEELHLEKELGKSKIVTAHTSRAAQGGYWCDVCECLIKDSQAYLDHVNGKRHNRMLGMNMRVERTSAQQIRDKLRRLRQEGREAEGKGRRPAASSFDASQARGRSTSQPSHAHRSHHQLQTPRETEPPVAAGPLWKHLETAPGARPPQGPFSLHLGVAATPAAAARNAGEDEEEEPDAYDAIQARLDFLKQQEEERRNRRKEKKKLKRLRKGAADPDAPEKDEEQDEEATANKQTLRNDQAGAEDNTQQETKKLKIDAAAREKDLELAKASKPIQGGDAPGLPTTNSSGQEQEDGGEEDQDEAADLLLFKRNPLAYQQKMIQAAAKQAEKEVGKQFADKLENFKRSRPSKHQ
eukprot:GHVT01077353.1.p1 GENE.GHVT01077353.1~~GHVT01077353.1.p1  ORF type:complete len:429 (-),score=143.24 GHVT01077353.1:270-1556(-)